MPLAGRRVRPPRGAALLAVLSHRIKLAEFKADLPTDEALLRISYHDYDESFGGHTVHIGPMFMTGAVKLDLDALPDGEHVPAKVEVIGDGWFHAQRGIPEDQPEPPDDPPPSGQGHVSFAVRLSP